jgi:hypothetical protein
MSRLRSVVSVAVVCAMGLPGWTLAGDPPASVGNAQHASTPPAASVQQSNVDIFGAPVSSDTLKRYSGGAINITSKQISNGTVSNDSASQVVTGNNAITGDAFSSASGLPTVIQNTGNNVLIQNGVIVNVEMKP